MGSSSADNPLLQPPPPETAAAYFAALLADAPGLRVGDSSRHGKGLFAARSFEQGEELFRERPLVAVQQLHSKLEVSTCAHCFRAVGTVEQACGGKICCLINELSEADEDDDLRSIQDRVDKIQAAVDSRFLEGLLLGKVQLPLADRLSDMTPNPVKCRGSCGEEYCDARCEAAAWERHHCLLCPGGPDEPAASSSSSDKGKAAAQQRSSSRSGRHSCGGGAGSSGGSSKAPPREQLHGVSVSRAKLGEFAEHAADTNDIFHVAAQVIAATLISADRLLSQAAADAADDAEARAAYASALSAAAAGARAAAWTAALPPAGAAAACTGSQAGAGSSEGAGTPSAAPTGQLAQQAGKPSPEACLAALQAAFLPWAVGHKRPWQEVVAAAAAADTEDDTDPAELAAQVQEIAAESLGLLSEALRDERFPQLFDPQLYSELVGMFELNNLALDVPAPVQRYSAMLQQPEAAGISADEAAAAQQEVQPLLAALGERADTPAEATGFMALQSRINHSCRPCAAVHVEPSGEVVVAALEPIPAGAEVTLSYIQQEGADLQQRRAMLADYGFVCACELCEAEALAASVAGVRL